MTSPIVVCCARLHVPLEDKGELMKKALKPIIYEMKYDTNLVCYVTFFNPTILL